MKLLFIAYACEPDSASESFLAYETVCGIAQKIDGTVHVLTRLNNLEACQKDERAQSLGIVWHGCDGGRVMLWLKQNVPLFSIQVYAIYWQFLAARTARALAVTQDYDLVHGLSMMSLHNFAAGLTGLPSIIGPVGGAQEIPQSCRKYGDPIQEIPRMLSIRTTPYLPGWRKAVRAAKRILCANEETAQYFLRQGVPEENIAVRQPGYPGIAFADQTVADIKPEALPAVLDIFWGGRLVRCKGLEVLLDAVAKARNEGLKCFLHITGDGPDKKKFAIAVRRLGIQEFVKFYGWIPKEEMRQLRSRCHLLTFTSLRETTGLALIEMLLSGQPAAVLNCGGPRSIIEGLPCFVVEPEQAVEGLVAVMRSVLDDYPSALERARQTKAGAFSKFDWNAYLNNLTEWYSEIVSVNESGHRYA